MTRYEQDILTQLAQDVGYIRGQIDTLVDARLPDRMTFVEGQQKVQNSRIQLIETKHEKLFAKALIFLATIGTLASGAAGWVFAFH